MAGFYFATLLSQTASYVVMDWNTTHAFGPDGPWQTLLINNSISSTINLFPSAGFRISWLPTSQACGISGCDGGVLSDYIPVASSDYTFNQLLPLEFSGINYTAELFYNASWFEMTIGNLGSYYTQSWNASVAAGFNSTITYPSGKSTVAEVGMLSMGISPLVDTQLTACPNHTCNPPVYLYQQNITQSISYSYHIGSASLAYPGSAVFGGYDKGRAIGPAINTGDELYLLDITIGVETGDSPFPFTQEVGLLKS